jgi:hypothetical protein
VAARRLGGRTGRRRLKEVSSHFSVGGLTARVAERARRLHKLAPAPQQLEELARADPTVLGVHADDMARALAESAPAID